MARRSRKDPLAGIPSPLEFFGHLNWIDGRPLADVIEPYRARIFTETLFTFDGGRPRYNLVLAGRGKKNWKSADLVLAALYRFLAWPSAQGNDGFIIANDEGQANDNLRLAKKLLGANAILAREVEPRVKELVRRDGGGTMAILPAKDVMGAHGKTYLFVGFDEIHGYRNWDLFEALAPDPTRPDALTWITSYASIYNHAGAPLYDLTEAGKRGDDPAMYFSWYSADYCTEPDAPDDSELRANPSIGSWSNGRRYLAQQRRRLPAHKFRRLHLNLPGLPDGAALDPGAVMDAIVGERKRLLPVPDRTYVGFVDMSGGSGDDATLAVAHLDEDTERVVLDMLMNQGEEPPFNPRHAVTRFAGVLREYGLFHVSGDRYAGQTFRDDFEDHSVDYEICDLSKSQLYEALEPRLNASEVELLDVARLQEQLLGLVWRGSKIDHVPGEHDDFANAAAGAVWLAADGRMEDWAGQEPTMGPRLVCADPPWITSPGDQLGPWER